MTRSTLFAAVSATVSLVAALALATAYAQAPPAGGPPQGPQGAPPEGGPPQGAPQNSGANEATSYPVLFVTGIDVLRAPQNGRDIIVAHGLVSSSDWRSPTSPSEASTCSTIPGTAIPPAGSSSTAS